MKKNVLFKKIPLILLCSILIGGLAASCASTNYIEKIYPENMQKLMECQAYNDEVVIFFCCFFLPFRLIFNYTNHFTG